MVIYRAVTAIFGKDMLPRENDDGDGHYGNVRNAYMKVGTFLWNAWRNFGYSWTLFYIVGKAFSFPG